MELQIKNYYNKFQLGYEYAFQFDLGKDKKSEITFGIYLGETLDNESCFMIDRKVRIYSIKEFSNIELVRQAWGSINQI